MEQELWNKVLIGDNYYTANRIVGAFIFWGFVILIIGIAIGKFVF